MGSALAPKLRSSSLNLELPASLPCFLHGSTKARVFFINAESAYIRLYRALADAKERGRHDLIERYSNQMSTLVKATSYETLVSRLRNNQAS